MLEDVFSVRRLGAPDPARGDGDRWPGQCQGTTGNAEAIWDIIFDRASDIRASVDRSAWFAATGVEARAMLPCRIGRAQTAATPQRRPGPGAHASADADLGARRIWKDHIAQRMARLPRWPRFSPCVAL